MTDYKCNCLDWTLGRNCENVFNPCTYNPCLNGGTCSKRRTLAYECTCQTGYIGLRCDQRLDESCLKKGCNRGKCMLNETNGQYSCQCGTGFVGNNCETERCNPKCKNGVCKETGIGTFRCECTSNYKGAACDTLGKF